MYSATPQTRYHIAELGSLLSDPARAAILLALMDGTIRPAGELAQMARIAPSTASAHLKRLTDGELLAVVEQGRHRYYRLANERVAQMIENLSVAGVGAPPSNPWRGDPVMLKARTCYDHLAGALGVALFETIRAADGFALSGEAVHLSEAGRRRLRQAGLLGDGDAVGEIPGRTCVDWTERRFHLGGKLGAWLASRLFQREWLRRRNSTRALTATTAGRKGLSALGLEWDELARISHRPAAAGADLPASTALRSARVLDVLSSTPARSCSRAPCSYGHLHALASRTGEKCGLAG